MKLKSLIFIACAGLFASSCNKDYLDVNTNPNALTGTISPSFVFTNALAGTTANMVGQNELGSYWSGQWTQSSSYIFSATTFAYQFTNTNFNYWDPIYNNLQDYQYVIDNADAQGQPFLKGPAQVMKAMLFQNLVDMYGNVPYSEALKGLGNLAPKFDDQKAVYESLIPLLDTAIKNLKANAFTGVFGGSDIAFAGNRTKWQRFANSLKMRILIRQSRVAGRAGYITTEIKKAIAEGSGFLDAGEDASVNPGYQPTTGKMNPMYETWGYNASGSALSLGRYPRPTKFLFDELIKTNDTFRLKRLAYPIGGQLSSVLGGGKTDTIIANYKGVPYGSSSGYTAPSTSYIGPSVFERGVYNKPLYLMTAAESQFLLAEAAQLYGATVGLPKTAKDYYEQGVKEAFRLVGSSQVLASRLLNSGIEEADWNASPDKLKAIWKQKWISMVNFEGLQAWSEYRRTNYPNIPASAGAAATQKPPVRLFYPGSELGSNEANVKAQGTIDVFSSRIFWDVD